MSHPAPRVLIVEDSPTQARVLKRALERAALQVEIEESAEAALVRLRGGDPFDLVLTDLHLPGKTGFDLCREVRGTPSLAGLPILVQTAQDDAANVLRGLEAGADGFMTKDRPLADTVARIGRALRHPRRAVEAGPPARVDFLGTTYTIATGREQILDVLVTAFESTVELSRRLRESEDALQTTLRGVLDTVPVGILSADVAGWPRLFNRAAAEITGRAEPAPLDDWVSAYGLETPDGRVPDPSELPARRALARPDARAQAELVVRRPDGERVPVLLDARAVVDSTSRTSEVLCAITSIAELKAAQAEQRRALEAEMRALSASKAKSSFLANMSHELRTPLNAILGYGEMLSDDLRDLGAPSLEGDLQKILAAGRHLMSLINDILDLSKIEAGRMDLHLEEFDVAALVADTASSVQPLAAKNDNRLVVNDLRDVGAMFADARKLRQSLLNLLSNACKFTHNGTVTISGRRERVSGGDEVVLSVRDSGIGMTPDELSRVFQEFTQADASTTRKYGGTGLGLTLTRRFCRMMKGDVTAESTPGVGTVFTIRLPAQVPSPAPARG